MAIQIKQDGIYVDGTLQIPSDKEIFVNEVYNKLTTDGIKTINGESILGTGDIQITSKVLQVISLFNNEAYFFNTKNEVELPGLNTIITPVKLNSKFIVFGTLALSKFYVGSIALKFGRQWINAPTSGNSQHNNSFITTHSGNGSTIHLKNYSFTTVFDNPGITTPTYIGIYAKNTWTNKGYKFYYNNRRDNDMQSSSSVVIMEVAQ